LSHAVLLIWLFGKVMRRGVSGSKRYMELDRLRKEWQAKAERGEIPQTTPGGPKVWRDELEPEARRWPPAGLGYEEPDSVFGLVRDFTRCRPGFPG